MHRVIAYVDGFNLYYGIKEKSWRRYYWLNIERLVQSLLLPDQYLQAVKYFTALVSSPPQDPYKNKRQTTYIDALNTLPNIQIFYGHYLKKSVKCFACGNEWTSHEEKKTDVNMAVEILGDAYQNNFDTALIISGDSDLADLVRTVRSTFSQKRVVTAFPPARHSGDLKKASNHAFTIGRKKLADSQFPDTVTRLDGYPLQRPERWR